MPPIAVLIPTFRRPDSLARALASVFAQERKDLIRQIVVVDNAPEGSARQTVDDLRPQAPAPLIYLHAQPPGVATARNVGLTAVDAPYVAFLDDDEAASPQWLGALFEVHYRIGADVTFGPVQGKTPEAAPWKRLYLERFFSRLGPARSGLIDEVYGCGNSLMTRATALPGPAPFDEAANDTGGEDDRLFADLQTGGATFAWAAEAIVDEHPPTHRTTLYYALSRAVSYGQSPTQLCWRRGDRLGAIKWMGVGAGQTILYGATALAMLLTANRGWIDMLDRAARGLGKILWFRDAHFYGQGAARFVGVTPPPETALRTNGQAELTGAPKTA
jgi:glycosyltransferase involved in cell wall biosynthesis